MIAAEQKARSTYDNILRTVKDIPEIADPIRFLRAREVVHFQRFGEALRSLQEQKARSTYDNILRTVKDIPEIADPIRFLRAREVVHFQRFGEALRSLQEELDAKNFYAFNPSFDMPASCSCPSECGCRR